MLIKKKKLISFFLLLGSIYLASTDHPQIITVANTGEFPGRMDSK